MAGGEKAMSFHSFMDELERKNPGVMRAEKFRITAMSFRQQLRRAYDAGVKDTLPDASTVDKLRDILKRDPFSPNR